MKRIVLNSWIIWMVSFTTARAGDTVMLRHRLSPSPVMVNGSREVRLDLGGSWRFHPAPEAGFEFRQAVNNDWKKIDVPGEWAMQGFTVAKGTWAGYARSFTVPAGWNGRRIKLHCDAVYSACEVFINGKKAGYHLGGFTPFEYDITEMVQAGIPAVITMKVKNETLADSLASGTQYAVHPLGGITRKLYLMTMPELNISLFHTTTTFDTAYHDAVLQTDVELSNDGLSMIKNASLQFELFSPGGRDVVLSKTLSLNDAIGGKSTLKKTFSFPVPEPRKWDPEHPNLYLYRLSLVYDGATEVVERNVGFRQIAVRGNKLYVNNMPIKVRGACRHEVMPLRGRSLSGDQWVEDVRLFREENVNYIRTSHYPPAEEFMHACDSLGMFVEVEAPFCWADGTNVPDSLYQAAIIDQTLDMVNFYKDDPAVLVWSLANESQGAYKRYFRRSGELVKKLDPTRPRIYNQYGDEGDNGELELLNEHYPGPEGPAKYRYNSRPVIFGEYAHLNAYNRLELVTDPGLRDAWGEGFRNMWEKMYASPSVAGGAIWAGIDDTFVLPDGRVVGYGTWGPLDGWRRKKPEYWHVKKTYSPVKILQAGNYRLDSVGLLIENRLLFSNLEECLLTWRAGASRGHIKASIPPGGKETVMVALGDGLRAEDSLYIEVRDPRGVLIDEYAFRIVPEVKEEAKTAAGQVVPLTYIRKNDTVAARGRGFRIVLDGHTGVLRVMRPGMQGAMMELGALMLLPLNGEGRGTQMTGEDQVFDAYTSTAAHRVVSKVEYGCRPDKFTVTVFDGYDEAAGSTQYVFSGDGRVEIRYRYRVNKDINPRQWGMVMTLATDFNTLSWRRRGLWNYYPGNHIGRLAGVAEAYSAAPVTGPAGPLSRPSWPWAQDRNELGTNDFRSTKMFITEGRLRAGNVAVTVLGNGDQHLRAWKEGGLTKLLVAGYSNLGAEGFFRGHAARFDKPLREGDVIEDSIWLRLP